MTDFKKTLRNITLVSGALIANNAGAKSPDVGMQEQEGITEALNQKASTVALRVQTKSTAKRTSLITEAGETIIDSAGFNLRLSLRDVFMIKPGEKSGVYQLRTPESGVMKGKLSRESIKNILAPGSGQLFELKKDFNLIVNDGNEEVTFTDPLEYARWAADIGMGGMEKISSNKKPVPYQEWTKVFGVDGVEAPTLNEDGVVVFSNVEYPTNCRANKERTAVRNCMRGRGGYESLQEPYEIKADNDAMALAQNDLKKMKQRGFYLKLKNKEADLVDRILKDRAN